MPLILYKPRFVTFICLQSSQVVHFVSIRARTFVMISLQAERNVKVLVLDKISRKNDMRRNRDENDERGDGEEGSEW